MRIEFQLVVAEGVHPYFRCTPSASHLRALQNPHIKQRSTPLPQSIGAIIGCLVATYQRRYEYHRAGRFAGQGRSCGGGGCSPEHGNKHSKNSHACMGDYESFWSAMGCVGRHMKQAKRRQCRWISHEPRRIVSDNTTRKRSFGCSISPALFHLQYSPLRPAH
jgi:hypothetical protein